jgi:protein TonB
VTTVIGSSDSNAAAPMPAGPGSGTGVVTAPAKINIAEEPPPPAAPSPTPRTAPISGGVLNGKAISLPKPAYPPIARAAHAAGTVVVQVLIDENGNVVSAKAVSGHPLLQAVAVSAARQARFSPTKLSGQPVKVTGVIQYNFVAQ